MQPPLLGSQVGAAAVHWVLSALCTHVPLLHVSAVQAMLSLQSASAQQALQVLSAQHLVPLVQLLEYVHLPDTHAGVWHAPAATQSELFAQLFVTWQPFTGSQACPALHCVESALWPQIPCAHESLVQATESSQSPAEQHAPQVAEVLSTAAQHCWPSAHKLEC
jgi:hypothetical protein